MSYVTKTISGTIADYLNRNTFLPAIQREYVWSTQSLVYHYLVTKKYRSCTVRFRKATVPLQFGGLS